MSFNEIEKHILSPDSLLGSLVNSTSDFWKEGKAGYKVKNLICKINRNLDNFSDKYSLNLNLKYNDEDCKQYSSVVDNIAKNIFIELDDLIIYSQLIFH